MSCGPNRPPRWSRNNRCCNLFSKPFFAMGSYDLPDFLLARAREPFRNRDAAARIHAHVERAVEAEAEAADRDVDLRRGAAQIDQTALRSDEDRRHRGGWSRSTAIRRR